MKIVIFGLTVSSSWGNGHATLWRGLCRALAARGHWIVFFERDVPYYAAHRDLCELPGGALRLYADWESAWQAAEQELADADAGMVTSYCPDGVAASRLTVNSGARLRVFYDLDTPVTLGELREGRGVAYIPPEGLRDFDLTLSYTGGKALHELQSMLGARAVAPLYGSVDPAVHHRVESQGHYQADLSYIGTYAQDRQQALERLFIEPARRLPERRFVLAGAQYPVEFPWADNIYFVRHLPPDEHAAFYSSSRLTLNITRAAMAAMGYCPSGRFFEAAACGTPILSDAWEGLESFYEPGSEILVAHSTEEAVDAVNSSDARLARIARAAYERTLDQYTAERRAVEFEQILDRALSSTPQGSLTTAPSGMSWTGSPSPQE